MRSRDEIQSLLAAILDHVGEGEAEATYSGERALATRFGENAITQNIGSASEQVAVTIAHGARRGSASTNKLDRDALAEMVARADAIARHAPEDPEHVPLPGPQEYLAMPPGYFEDVAALTPEQVARDVGEVVRQATARGYTASGLFDVRASDEAIANTHGVFGHYRHSTVDYSTTVHGPDGSGKAALNRHAYAQVDVGGLARTAVEHAAMAQDPRPIEPGDYTVILEPAAAMDLLALLVAAMSARDAEEGSTAFAGAAGTRLLNEKVTIRLRCDDADVSAPPFGDAGLAVRPTIWIESGVVRRLYHNRYWAARKGVAPDAALLPLFMDGEDRSVADLVRQCRRGLLVKNFWYIRHVDRRSLMLTGMTRDGLFLVENGEIVGPVKNLRWNESPVVLLQNVVALSRPERVASWVPAKVPAILSENFTFTSTTDSV